MRKLSFHLNSKAGLEFVFSSGQAASYPPHSHLNSFTITLVRKGTVAVKRPGGCALYQAGEVYIDAPHEVHRPSYDDDYDLVSLCLDKKELPGPSGEALEELFLNQAGFMSDRGLLSSADVAALLSGVSEISGDREWLLKAKAEPLAKLPGLQPLLNEPANTPGLYPPQGSSSHFSRRFKELLGLTPHQYLLQCRIRSAKKMLAADMPIAEAAQLAGFCDQSHLNRCFKKSVGLSPKQYVRACSFF